MENRAPDLQHGVFSILQILMNAREILFFAEEAFATTQRGVIAVNVLLVTNCPQTSPRALVRRNSSAHGVRPVV